VIWSGSALPDVLLFTPRLGDVAMSVPVGRRSAVDDPAPFPIVDMSSRRTVVNTLKSGFVVAVMLAAGYGAYVMLVKPPPMPGSEASIESDWSEAQLAMESLSASDASPPPLAENWANPPAAMRAIPSTQPPSQQQPAYSPPSMPSDIPMVQLPQQQQPAYAQPAFQESRPVAVIPAIATPAPSAPAGVAQTHATEVPLGRSYAQATNPPHVPWADDAPITHNVPQSPAGLDSTDTRQTSLPGAPVATSSHSEFANPTSNELPAHGSEPTDAVGEQPIVGSENATDADRQNEAFENDWQTAETQLAGGKTADALFALSMWYENPEMSEQQNMRLLERLDQLAGSVIYSTQHSVQPPYQVRTLETLESISQSFQIPWQFLANVNGISDPSALTPGRELKVVHGPFRSEVDLDRRTLTVFLGRFYAGRFNVQLGQDPFPDTGEYDVLEKTLDGRDFYGSAGQLLSAGDPSNPYGNMIIQLTDNLVIHSAMPGSQPAPGCIMLSEQDLADLYAILSPQSRVVIKATTPRTRHPGTAASVGYAFPSLDYSSRE